MCIIVYSTIYIYSTMVPNCRVLLLEPRSGSDTISRPTHRRTVAPSTVAAHWARDFSFTIDRRPGPPGLLSEETAGWDELPNKWAVFFHVSSDAFRSQVVKQVGFHDICTGWSQVYRERGRRDPPN